MYNLTNVCFAGTSLYSKEEGDPGRKLHLQASLNLADL
jgi:hypothetical protein